MQTELIKMNLRYKCVSETGYLAQGGGPRWRGFVIRACYVEETNKIENIN